MARPGPVDDRAIVRPSLAARHFRLDRYHPEPPLDRFVDRFWVTEWDLDEPFVQTVVTFPVVNLVIQGGDAADSLTDHRPVDSVRGVRGGDRAAPDPAGAAVISGVQTVADRRRLVGRGWAVGMMFRPGGFRPFVDRPLSDLTDRRLPARDLFGPESDRVVAAVLDAGDDEARIDRLARLLGPLVPGPPTVGEALAGLIEQAVAERPPVTRADVLARRHGVSVRTLQRLFADQVGLGPKRVLERYRVHAAAELVHAGPANWAVAARQLGYADQAHLTADLSTVYGTPPATYAHRESSTAPRPPAGGADRPRNDGGPTV